MISIALAAAITAAECEKNMAFVVHLKPKGYVCLANDGRAYIEPGTPLDAAAFNFLRTLGNTARQLNENERQLAPRNQDGT